MRKKKKKKNIRQKEFEIKVKTFILYTNSNLTYNNKRIKTTHIPFHTSKPEKQKPITINKKIIIKNKK